METTIPDAAAGPPEQSAQDPVIIGFFCTWCACMAADVAGMARTSYAASLRPIRVMCSSSVEPGHVLKALREGADGVLIVGCHPGACHYVDGNLKALRRFALLRRLLAQLGVEHDRVQLVWVSASEGTALATAIDRMARQLRSLGPLRWSRQIASSDAPVR